ncbi:type II/IV secretion system protein [Subsaximicrobium wynnwilliamsii]|uniref:Type II/IV secretion system protein n=1 Tax=Subsaximicrobium wynnwilliamsii TaxID=291179 RepID=A0A5C6ZIY9_9FLAO|nr:GspE/PulE family protein [Subsaximicrobium wynnwilliamsii]TXD83469.1 type II/IV secretion system protein [Subsaximicrobium wynnwilliamsii]TXD89256.1 type II/IV secretion system protein [Subsaximicrobium wynnwilliamsii]TXE03149.1 type II/IV secretion system protein [Subsaximicrobium wynnwilliamsii]
MTEDFQIPTNLLQLLSSEQAHHYRIVPIESHNGTIAFKSDKVSEGLQQELRVVLNTDIELIEDTSENIQNYLSVNFRKSKNIQSENLHYSSDFLDKLLMTAKDIGSSDIHFEPYEHKCRVRFRMDGKLKEQFIIALHEYPVIVNKLKIQAGLDISEKRLPQDGRITVKTVKNEFDIRVSSLPTLHGEKMVLRILSKDATHIDLDALGFTESELRTYKETVRKPNGIILISGPTGSGKTTTLYATLKLLNNDDTNILTIEDPIEYTLEGVNQVQLKENIGLDFSSTLRTFLRQDPDIIMVGEIRDAKTANMAIRAALTGHLVLSTIHTNSAWATISRLIDMGIPSFLIASTLNVSVAQRLVRKLCVHCKQKSTITKELFPSNFEIPKHLKSHFLATGCNACHHTGYQGRKAIYEIIPITKILVQHIKENDLEVDSYLEEHNVSTLRSNAVSMIEEGITSIDEVYALLSD